MSVADLERRRLIEGLVAGGCAACFLGLAGAGRLLAQDRPSDRPLIDPDESDLPLHPARWYKKLEGGRAFVGSYAGIFTYVLDEEAQPVFEEFFRTQGWAQDIVVDEDRAYVPSGYYGVQILELGSGPHL